MKKDFHANRDIIFLDCSSNDANYLITIKTTFAAWINSLPSNQKYAVIADSQANAELIATNLCDNSLNNAFDSEQCPSTYSTTLSIKTFN